MVRFRKAREDDVPALRGLYSRSVRTLGAQHYGIEALDAWAQFSENSGFGQFILGNDTFVAVRRGQIVGFSGIDPSGRIASLYVSPEFAGQGIGAMMLRVVLDRGREAGLSNFRTEASEMSRHLFERFGFSLTERETVTRSGVQLHRYLMTLTESPRNPPDVDGAPSDSAAAQAGGVRGWAHE